MIVIQLPATTATGSSVPARDTPDVRPRVGSAGSSASSAQNRWTSSHTCCS